MDEMKQPPVPSIIETMAKGDKLVEQLAVAKIARQQLSRMAEKLLSGSDGLNWVEDLARAVSSPELRNRMAFLIRDFCAEHLRPEVKRFAGLMELKLLKHDPARGMSWKADANPLVIFAHINELMGELESALCNNQKVGIKAADIANHLMILADLAGDLGDV